MTIKLYYNLVSQPSRAMYILLKTIKCDFQPYDVDMRKGEHLSDEYTKLYRLQRVPVLDYNGFVMGESVAMIKFLAKMDMIPDTLYPKDAMLGARVDEFLEWQHLGLRVVLAMYFRSAVLEPKLTNTAPNPKRIADYEKRMIVALENVEQKWLGRGTKFLVGDTVSVADLWAACEIEQPRMAGFEPEKRYANIAAWIKEVRSYFNPHYEEAHTVVNKISSKYAGKTIDAKL